MSTIPPRGPAPATLPDRREDGKPARLLSYPPDRLAARLHRLDALVATEQGRELGATLTAARGALGPDQVPALLAYLDASIADGEARDGSEIAYRGLCAMGDAGRPHLDTVMARLQHLRSQRAGMALEVTVRLFIVIGLDDDEIRRRLDFDEVTGDTQAWADDVLQRTRPKVEKSFASWAAREVPPDGKPLRHHPCL